MAYNSGYWEELEGSLRKQLAEARDEVERLALEIENQHYTITCASEENQQLKESLAEARAENAALVAEFQRLADEPPTLEEIAADLDKIEMLGKELAGAQAEIERLREYTTCTLESTDAEMDDKDIQIIKKDKLIEQLKKALESVRQKHYVNDDDNWYSCPASGLCSKDSAGTDCDCGADHVNSIIQAALRAADGGE